MGAGGTSFTPFHRGGDGPPLLLLHGFTDTWRTWEPVLPLLERRFEVLAPTLAGHAGGPPIPDGVPADEAIADAIEAALDEAGWDAPAVAGNSLGGYIALQLAARGRARSVVALAPAGGWAIGDRAIADTHRYFRLVERLVRDAAPRAEEIVATPEGRARASAAYATNADHISADLAAHMIRGAAACETTQMIEHVEASGWEIDAAAVTCPVRIVWGTDDKILPLPGAAVRHREEWFPNAEWIEIDGAGHCPQLDHPVETAELAAGFSG